MFLLAYHISSLSDFGVYPSELLLQINKRKKRQARGKSLCLLSPWTLLDLAWKQGFWVPTTNHGRCNGQHADRTHRKEETFYWPFGRKRPLLFDWQLFKLWPRKLICFDWNLESGYCQFCHQEFSLICKPVKDWKTSAALGTFGMPTRYEDSFCDDLREIAIVHTKHLLFVIYAVGTLTVCAAHVSWPGRSVVQAGGLRFGNKLHPEQLQAVLICFPSSKFNMWVEERVCKQSDWKDFGLTLNCSAVIIS